MLDTLEAWEVCARYLSERIEKTKNEPRFSIPFLREELEIAPDHYSGDDREVYYSREDRRFHTYVQHWDGGNMFASFSYGDAALTNSEIVSQLQRMKGKTEMELNEEERKRLERAYTSIVDALMSLCKQSVDL